MTDQPPGPRRTGPVAAAWWSDPALSRIWRLIAQRLERDGLAARGQLPVSGLSRDEQRALSDLLGTRVLATASRLDLPSLDRRLRERAGPDLVAAAREMIGRDLVALPARRSELALRREEPYAAYRAWREAHTHATWDWLDEWFASLRRDGILGRDPEPARLVTSALEVLWHRRAFLLEALPGSRSDTLPDDPVPHPRTDPHAFHALPGRPDDPVPDPRTPIARTELAAHVLGDAHGLDDDRRLAAAVVRALDARAAALGRRVQSADRDDPDVAPDRPTDRDRRARWEELGVLTDRVSSTCLTLGLRVTPDHEGERYAAYGRTGVVLHVTWRDLDAGLSFEPGQDVLVCENPRVLEAAAERAEVAERTARAGQQVRAAPADQAGQSGPPITGNEVGVVCTSGRPALVTMEVLARLGASGCRLRYHGDFDWAGIAMTNDLVTRFGVLPWRMSTADYATAPATLPLAGRQVDALWDLDLAPAMAQRGLVVHEEALLPGLLDGLM